MGGIEKLSEAELLILRSIPGVADVEALAKLTRIKPATLGMEIAKLQVAGFVADDGSLTEKGLKAIGK